MKIFFIWIAILVALCSGCSIYKAATAPPPLAVENVKVGKSRDEIIASIGLPKSSENKGDVRTDMHEFTSGSPEGTKIRIVLYVAGDVFTIGLAELVFWPIELAAGQGTDGRAIVTYGMDNIAKSVLMVKRDGTPWKFGSVAALDQGNVGSMDAR
jgi:hypothetical protein